MMIESEILCSCACGGFPRGLGYLGLLCAMTYRVATLRLASGYNRRPMRVRKPSLGAVLLGLIPFVAMCLSVSLWDRVEPMIFGLPFNLFWLIAWIVLSSLCMWAAYLTGTVFRSVVPS
jgi:hypothetical protein